MNPLYLFGSALATFILGWQILKRFFPWIPCELRFLRIILGTTRILDQYEKRKPPYLIIDKLVDQANKQPDKVHLIFKDEKWTFREVNEFTNQVARVMRHAGIGCNKTVAVMMTSCPELLGVLYGVAKTGGTTSLLNNRVRKKSLIHLLDVVDSGILIVSNEEEILEAVAGIQDYLDSKEIKVFVVGDVTRDFDVEYKSLSVLLANESKEEIDKEWRQGTTLKSHFCYIYTSGTTGLPKAAIVQHSKAWLMARITAFLDVGGDEIIYTPLPLYHSSGLIGAFGAISLGCTIVLRTKFSASHFWSDCRRYKATIVQYIGETMRYVCDQSPSNEDKNHSVRIALGNGMRKNVWEKFHDRFGRHIRVVEFYAATESNVGFLNMDGQVASVGLYTPLRRLGGVRIIRYDQENDEIYKDKNGKYVEVSANVPGLIIGKITKTTEFHGYRGDQRQTESKILRNVFEEGDAYFNTGDLVKYDEQRHMYFVDRVGDTYRWKSENVSTNEVADVMTSAPGIKEANVYGVEVQGNEGRVGMMVAILKDSEVFDCSAVYKYVCDCLASYARPLFIRVKKEMELTVTFKQMKVQLVKDGFEPKNMGGDQIYFLSQTEKSYVELTQEMVEEIKTGNIRV